MQTQAPVYLEYRCTHCWNSNVASSDSPGRDATCKYCGQSNIVPEATTERIERALLLLERQPDLLDSVPSENSRAFHFDRELTDQEMYAIVKQRTKVPLRERDFSGYENAALWRRSVACFIDSILLIASFILSLCAVEWASRHGFAVENPIDAIRHGVSLKPSTLILIGIVPALFVIIQSVLISVSGQSIGKQILLIRIVTDQGRIPGFLCGVVMRYGIPASLCLIPYVGEYWYLLDAFCYFLCGKRFAHDVIASTRVVSLFH